MSKGYIVVQLFTARQARPITNATVIISRPDTGGESVIRTVQVDREGKTEPIEVDTLPKSLSLDETYEGTPYTTYDITIRAFNFANQLIRRVQVFESEITLQQVELIPFDREAYNNNTDFIFETPAHSLTPADGTAPASGEFFTAGSDPAGAAARDRPQPACSASGNTPRQCGKCLCLFSGLH